MTRYDENYALFWKRAYSIDEKVAHGYSSHEKFEYRMRVFILGPDTRGYKAEEVDTLYEQAIRTKTMKPLFDRANAWLDKNRPDWQAPFAYWE